MAEEPLTPDPPAAAYETAWALRLHGFAKELSGALQLILDLCGDKATSRAVMNGDRAARVETLRAFLRLAGLHRRYLDEFNPPPGRYKAVGRHLHAALTSTHAAAVAFQKATDTTVIDLDHLDFAKRNLAHAARLIQAIADPTIEPPTPPPTRRKPQERRKTDD